MQNRICFYELGRGREEKPWAMESLQQMIKNPCQQDNICRER